MLVRRSRGFEPAFCAATSGGPVSINPSTDAQVDMSLIRHQGGATFTINAGAIVVPVSGWYSMTAGFRFASYGGAFRDAIPAITTESARVGIKINGASPTGNFSFTSLLAGTVNANASFTRQIALTAGTELAMTVRHYYDTARSVPTNAGFIELMLLNRG